jgi:transposase
MQVFRFEKLARSERAASRYLLDMCEKMESLRCRKCGFDRLYVIEEGRRRRCASCGHSFNPFQGRWLDKVKISAREWLWIVKLFELNNPVSMIAEETDISYPTVLRAVDAVRAAIIGPSSCPETWHCTCGTGASGHILGVSRGHLGAVNVLEAIPAELVKCAMKLKGGWMVCTDRDIPYSSIQCGEDELKLVDRGERFPRCRVYLSGMEGFWTYARERLLKYHGITDEKMPLYIREMEFRFLHRDEQLFDLLIEKLCGCSQSRKPSDHS